MQKPFKLLNRRSISLGDYFNAPVIQIAHKTVDSQLKGFIPRIIPKRNSLDPPLDQVSERLFCHGGIQTRSFL